MRKPILSYVRLSHFAGGLYALRMQFMLSTTNPQVAITD